METVTLKSLTEKLKHVPPSVLEKISDYADELLNEKPRYDAAYAATLTGEEKIAYWRKVGYTEEESKQRLFARMAKWQWEGKK